MEEKENFSNSDNASLLKEMALEAFELNNFKDSLDFFSQYISQTPQITDIDIAVIHFNMGVCYQKLKNNNDAKLAFTKALEIMPNYIKPRASRMNILKIEGEYEQALEDAKKIYEIDIIY